MNNFVYDNMNHVTRRYVDLLGERDALLNACDTESLQEIEEALYEMQDNRIFNPTQVSEYFFCDTWI